MVDKAEQHTTPTHSGPPNQRDGLTVESSNEGVGPSSLAYHLPKKTTGQTPGLGGFGDLTQKQIANMGKQQQQEIVHSRAASRVATRVSDEAAVAEEEDPSNRNRQRSQSTGLRTTTTAALVEDVYANGVQQQEPSGIFVQRPARGALNEEEAEERDVTNATLHWLGHKRTHSTATLTAELLHNFLRQPRITEVYEVGLRDMLDRGQTAAELANLPYHLRSEDMRALVGDWGIGLHLLAERVGVHILGEGTCTLGNMHATERQVGRTTYAGRPIEVDTLGNWLGRARELIANQNNGITEVYVPYLTAQEGSLAQQVNSNTHWQLCIVNSADVNVPPQFINTLGDGMCGDYTIQEIAIKLQVKHQSLTQEDEAWATQYYRAGGPFEMGVPDANNTHQVRSDRIRNSSINLATARTWMADYAEEAGGGIARRLKTLTTLEQQARIDLQQSTERCTREEDTLPYTLEEQIEARREVLAAGVLAAIDMRRRAQQRLTIRTAIERDQAPRRSLSEDTVSVTPTNCQNRYDYDIALDNRVDDALSDEEIEDRKDQRDGLRLALNYSIAASNARVDYLSNSQPFSGLPHNSNQNTVRTVLDEIDEGEIAKEIVIEINDLQSAIRESKSRLAQLDLEEKTDDLSNNYRTARTRSFSASVYRDNHRQKPPSNINGKQNNTSKERETNILLKLTNKHTGVQKSIESDIIRVSAGTERCGVYIGGWSLPFTKQRLDKLTLKQAIDSLKVIKLEIEKEMKSADNLIADIEGRPNLTLNDIITKPNASADDILYARRELTSRQVGRLYGTEYTLGEQLPTALMQQILEASNNICQRTQIQLMANEEIVRSNLNEDIHQVTLHVATTTPY